MHMDILYSRNISEILMKFVMRTSYSLFQHLVSQIFSRSVRFSLQQFYDVKPSGVVNASPEWRLFYMQLLDAKNIRLIHRIWMINCRSTQFRWNLIVRSPRNSQQNVKKYLNIPEKRKKARNAMYRERY